MPEEEIKESQTVVMPDDADPDEWLESQINGEAPPSKPSEEPEKPASEDLKEEEPIVEPEKEIKSGDGEETIEFNEADYLKESGFSETSVGENKLVYRSG